LTSLDFSVVCSPYFQNLLIQNVLISRRGRTICGTQLTVLVSSDRIPLVKVETSSFEIKKQKRILARRLTNLQLRAPG
jgi:hypothetical protein